MFHDFDFSSIPGAWLLLWQGMATTAWITLIATLIGLLWGTLLAVVRVAAHGSWLAWLAAGYVNLFRSVPLVMVILWFYLIVPQLLQALLGTTAHDIRLSSALTAFALFESAYYSEIIRAGIQSVPTGQYQAAMALGMPPALMWRSIILPQAIRRMIPLLLTQAIILFQDVSLVYVIGLSDFFGTAYKIGNRDGRLVELLLFAGAVYLLLSLSASLLVKRLQNR
ncbi:MAG: ABC transporter permease subunit [Magnetococcales bacterium]|nr:ABC transporter permease subunit [Magnetococcales bacterium]